MKDAFSLVAYVALDGAAYCDRCLHEASRKQDRVSGGRAGEMIQIRKEDLRREGKLWVLP